MSRSRYYPGRIRPRGYKGDWYDTLHNKRERLRSHLELVDGEREFWDTWDQDRDVLDYRTNWVHEVEARFRNHRTRGAVRRDRRERFACHVFACGCVARLDRRSKVAALLSKHCGKAHQAPHGYAWVMITYLRIF